MAYAKTRQSNFDLGDTLIKAKATLTGKDYAEVIAKSGLRSQTNAQNYIRIAEKTILREPGIFEHLPNTVGALIDLAAWSPELLKKAVSAKAINPHVKRKELRTWHLRAQLIEHNVAPLPDPDLVVGFIIADKDSILNDDWRLRKERVRKFLDQINALNSDAAFVASVDDRAHQFVLRRSLIRDKIRNLFSSYDKNEYDRSDLRPIFGEFDKFLYSEWNWNDWPRRLFTAQIDGSAPDLQLSFTEMEFIRCQGMPRRPYPGPDSKRSGDNQDDILLLLEYHLNSEPEASDARSDQIP